MGSKDFAKRLKRCIAELRKANLSEIDPIEVSRLRKQFDKLIDALADKPNLSEDLRNQIKNVKKAASFHQLLWGTGRMLKEPSAYRRHAKGVGALVEELIRSLHAHAKEGERS